MFIRQQQQYNDIETSMFIRQQQQYNDIAVLITSNHTHSISYITDLHHVVYVNYIYRLCHVK